MTVAELIRELQAMPQHRRVHILPSVVHHADESGHWTIHLSEEDASEADEVRDQGAFVLIRGK